MKSYERQQRNQGKRQWLDRATTGLALTVQICKLSYPFGGSTVHDLIEAIARFDIAESAADLIEQVIGVARAQGFGGVFLISPIGRDSREGRGLTYAGFDDTWARAYRRWLHRVDPMPEIILDRPRPFRWSETDSLRDLSEPESRYMAIMTQRGMADGWSIPLFGQPARIAMLGLGLHPDLAQVTTNNILELRIYFQMAYLRYCELISEEFERESMLSSREKDVLLWMSRGKSNSAIAIILDISTDTVDTYVRRIFKKFEVTDRVAAVMAAVRHGYVIAANYPRDVRPGPSADILADLSRNRVTSES